MVSSLSRFWSFAMIDYPPIRFRYFTQLTDHETYALGAITAQWAALEMLVETCTIFAAANNREPLPPGFETAGFSSKRRTFSNIIKGSKLTAEQRDECAGILDEIANLGEERRKVTHGVAYLDPTTRGGLRFVSASAHPKRTINHPSTLKRLITLAEAISVANGRLVRAMDYFML